MAGRKNNKAARAAGPYGIAGVWVSASFWPVRTIL